MLEHLGILSSLLEHLGQILLLRSLLPRWNLDMIYGVDLEAGSFVRILVNLHRLPEQKNVN